MASARALTFGLAACLAALAGCGSRSGLLDGGRGAGGGSTGGGTTPACTTWAAAPGEPVEIAVGSLGDVVAVGDRVFVAFGEGQGARLQVLRDDLTVLGDPQIAGVLRLAAGHGHRGLTKQDDDGHVSFVPLAEDGSAAGTPALVPASGNVGLIATPGGFAAIAEAYHLSMLSLDTAGHVVAEQEYLTPKTPEVAGLPAYALLDDGSFVLAWDADGGSLGASNVLNVQRFSAQGDAMNAPVSGSTGALVALAPLGSSVLEAFAPYMLDRVLVRSIDVNAGMAAPWVSLWTPKLSSSVAGLDVARLGDGGIVAWTVTGPPLETELRFQPVAADGSPVGKVLGLPPPMLPDGAPGLGAVRLSVTPAGIVVLFEGDMGQEPPRVFAMRLVCAD